VHQHDEVEALAAHAHHAFFELGNGHQVLHQGIEGIEAGSGFAEKLAARGHVNIIFLVVENGMHEALGGKKRCFQLVRHVGQELAA